MKRVYTAYDAVRGAPIYTEDIVPENALRVKALRSEHSHALIKRVDVSAALEVPGVLAVLTARDVPGENITGAVVLDRPFLAYEKVRCLADPIALVVAVDEEAADKAIEKIVVDYEVLEPVYDPVKALEESAPKVHENNLLRHYKLRKGDVTRGFNESDIIVEEEFRTQMQDPAPLEPEAAYAVPEKDGTLTIYGSIQNPFYVLTGVSRILGLPRDKINLVVMAIGGTFGGKSDEAPWDVCAMAGLAALKTGKPAACIYGRDESMIAHSHRHPAVMRYKVGATTDGRLKALDADIYFDTGAYASVGPLVMLRAVTHAAGPYVVENVRVDSYLVYTNNLTAGSMRGFGSPQVHFAVESMMDILADKLGMDPVELRLKNAWRQGVVTASDAVLMDNPDFGVLAEKVCEELGWRRGEKHPDEGVGIAFMAHGNSLGPEGEDKSSATVRISSDGTVHVATSLTEYGTGASRGFVKIAASVLGVPEDRVVVDRVETQKVPDSGGTFASRSTLMGGNAVYLAAKRLRERIERLIEESGHKGLDVVGFVRDVLREEVSEYAEFKLPVCDYNPETGKGTPYLQYTYGVVGVRVKVDRELGVVRVKDIVAAFDVGRVVNEGYLTAQLEGGITQGVAYGLLEELLIGKKHKVLNPNLADYLVPTAADMPRVKVIVIENPSPLTPLGTRTAGEPGIDAPAAAIANAVYDALKIRITSLPITPEKVVAALEKSEAIAVFV
ncbi:MAG: xanthine dehydrogenase family protein molybdopterin-binding subunit [Candidatus Caldarchaeum sp.]|uniref:Aldehyde oxidase/xanthine dehydrogenase a/b hammerhead domain-containing protein n=3 Tax=Caldiarchaeum subterraneum TaxID=311458 RepID=A0A7C4I5Y7_CALS0|nr:xanthine dehydrogenase family protein molybdopterin-binding subunit [Candidatus Caldarchaeales archaeon]